MRFALTHTAPAASFLCPEGFVGPRGTRPLLDERRTVGEARTLLDRIARAEKDVLAAMAKPGQEQSFSWCRGVRSCSARPRLRSAY